MCEHFVTHCANFISKLGCSDGNRVKMGVRMEPRELEATYRSFFDLT